MAAKAQDAADELTREPELREDGIGSAAKAVSNTEPAAAATAGTAPQPDAAAAARDDTAEADEDSDVEADVTSLLGKLRQMLHLGEATPKPANKAAPLLESFDLAGVASLIKQGKAKRIICMCGAGISVSAGIPDFRSPETGLYANLARYKLPHPQAVFELDYFRSRPEPFYRLAKELFPGSFRPTRTHCFMALLEAKGLLLRCFTQNIDSLERQAGLPAARIVAAHGNFDSAHCIECGREVPLEAVRASVAAEQPCRCPACRGLVKPDIVFFGENLPAAFFTRAKADFPQADLLIVMGTSLVVNPFASLIDRVRPDTPRLLINRERVGETDLLLARLGRGFDFDAQHRDALHLGDCDAAVSELAAALGWEAELQALLDGLEQPARL